jgi:serine/threonine protein kinase/Tol biopolymer transport system component
MSITALGEGGLVRAESTAIERGEVLAGRYQIEAVIGKGGSGIVLRAFDRVAQVPVALKLLKADLATDPRWIDRFSRELRLARQIQHPHVCRVFDIGQADGHWFISMELATGGTLRDQLGEHAKERPFEEKLADIRAVVAGLAAIHEAGIVHRDVKPDNFLRLEDGRLVLSDFGLATNPADAPVVSIMVGTPHYMAPEVVVGEVATRASDVWSAGVVIHEILTGERPERRLTRRNEPLKTPALANPVEGRILARVLAALEHEPELRPGGGAELSKLVEEALDPLSKRIRSRRRSQLMWGATAFGIMVAGVVLAKRLWTPADASTSGRTGAASQISPIEIGGTAQDWEKSSKVVSTFTGTVHCFSVLPGGETARIVFGTPRRIEDRDIATGRSRTPALPSETYHFGCPELSPHGDRLLFARLTKDGSSEIVLARADGTDARGLTKGTAPLWLPNGEEFVYDFDAAHIGLFSLPTMNFSLFMDGRTDVRRHVFRKSISPLGDIVAVTYNAEKGDRQLAVYGLPGMSLLNTWSLPPSIMGTSFRGESLMLSDAAGTPSLERLDWRSGVARRLGFVPNAEIDSVWSRAGDGQLIVAKTRSTDIWLFGANNEPRRLTNDGRSYLASQSPSGEVLVQKRTDDARWLIYLYDPSGRARPVTNGPMDAAPSFSPDGSSWVYIDHERKAIIRCDHRGCADLRVDPLVPIWPITAPDNQQIAYVTAVGTPRIHVVDGRGAHERDLGPSALECPPVWSSTKSLWVFSGAGVDRSWVEIDVPSGGKTGRTKAAARFNPDQESCGLESEPADSPFFQPARPVRQEAWSMRVASALPGF